MELGLFGKNLFLPAPGAHHTAAGKGSKAKQAHTKPGPFGKIPQTRGSNRPGTSLAPRSPSQFPKDLPEGANGETHDVIEIPLNSLHERRRPPLDGIGSSLI